MAMGLPCPQSVGAGGGQGERLERRVLEEVLRRHPGVYRFGVELPVQRCPDGRPQYGALPPLQEGVG